MNVVEILVPIGIRHARKSGQTDTTPAKLSASQDLCANPLNLHCPVSLLRVLKIASRLLLMGFS